LVVNFWTLAESDGDAARASIRSAMVRCNSALSGATVAASAWDAAGLSGDFSAGGVCAQVTDVMLATATSTSVLVHFVFMALSLFLPNGRPQATGLAASSGLLRALQNLHTRQSGVDTFLHTYFLFARGSSAVGHQILLMFSP
jgi:hypothetical protein